jgi:hypothetical protein
LYSNPVGSSQGILGAQGHFYETQVLQTSVPQQPSQPHYQQSQHLTTSVQRIPMAHQAVGQHDVQQVAQNGNPASNHEVVRSQYSLTSGYPTESSTQGPLGVDQSHSPLPQDPQLSRISMSWQHSSQPSQIPSNQQWPNTIESNNVGYQTSQTASSASATSQMTHHNAGQFYSNQNVEQNSYAQNPQTLQTLKIPSNGAYSTTQNPIYQQPVHTITHTYINNQQEQHVVYQQPDQPIKTGPTGETVTDEVVQNSAPPATDGSGIDARTKPEPSVEAAQRAASTNGAPGSAEGRKALLESALHCDLATYLVENVLENSSLRNVKDPASAKVHAVELLKILCQDPGYGMKFKLILEKIPAWKKYESQDHSLFITGHEQKTDYFLTDGSSTDPMKFLTNSKE